ncbi:MAG: DUF1957 domain-containing protein [Spirochaetaceae bacterium]|jgi:1,4-alpha-glucan branching enzyme|nr:DUF1957 domain-containing protein [Spirochaetaceae bacterium]GMO27057.1 MAG: DUF1957 domain-containing protein [Termitinemataceae bacterium]
MQKVICLVLNADTPFIRETGTQFTFQEMPLFESIEDTLLPLLELCERLEAEHIHFRFALVLPPILCQLLTDGLVSKRYLNYVDNRIAFGEAEMARLKNDGAAFELAAFYHNEAIKKRDRFCSRYQMNLLRSLLDFSRRGYIEFLGGTATNIFLPFYSAFPAIANAQVETARRSERRFFRNLPEGFWLPELGFYKGLDTLLRKHRFAWTIVDTHATLLAEPAPLLGSFYPVKTGEELICLTRDFFAIDEIMNITGNYTNSAFRSYFDDAGFELPAGAVSFFISSNGLRSPTGYKYRTTGKDGFGKEIYNPVRGEEAARDKARQFLRNRISALENAETIIKKPPVSICAYNAGFFGRFWYEGMHFLDELFRNAAKSNEVKFLTPSEYLENLDILEFQTINPSFSSQGYNGYGESYLDSSNDWIYRHLLRASERMTSLADRFKSGGDELQERALNQAAREILLAQTSDWTRIISTGEHYLTREWSNYAKNRLETHIRNFTTFYEALGSNHISTRLLTELELTNNIFPEMNYRVFCS